MTWKDEIRKAPERGISMNNWPIQADESQMEDLFDYFINDDSELKDDTVDKVKRMQGDGPSDTSEVLAILMKWPEYKKQAEQKIIDELEQLMDDYKGDKDFPPMSRTNIKEGGGSGAYPKQRRGDPDYSTQEDSPNQRFRSEQ